MFFHNLNTFLFLHGIDNYEILIELDQQNVSHKVHNGGLLLLSDDLFSYELSTLYLRKKLFHIFHKDLIFVVLFQLFYNFALRANRNLEKKLTFISKQKTRPKGFYLVLKAWQFWDCMKTAWPDNYFMTEWEMRKWIMWITTSSQ